MSEETRGLLPADVYERLYREAFRAADCDIVEIGGAAGTATIVMAWALLNAKKASSVIVVEKCEGGTRTEFGGREENLAIFQRNLRRNGVADRVRLFAEYLTFDNARSMIDLIQTEKIGGLVLDADGNIHRDLSIFWPMLVDGGFVAIDDCDPEGSAKHALTYRLIEKFEAWGMLRLDAVVGITWFGTKPPGSTMDRFSMKEAMEIVDGVCAEFRVRFAKEGIVPVGGVELA